MPRSKFEGRTSLRVIDRSKFEEAVILKKLSPHLFLLRW